MAKRPGRRIAPTKKHLAREERERRQMRFILAGSIITLVIVLVLVVYGVLDQYVLDNIRPVAVINGESISAEQFENFTRYNRYILIQNALQTYQFAEMFSGDPNSQAQFKSQIQQVISQLEPSSGTLGKDTLDQMVDAIIIRQKAQEMGLSVTQEELDIALQEAFGYFAMGTPTPSPTFELAPSSTLSDQQLTLIPPTATQTITPTLTASATLTDSEPLVSPTETQPTVTLQPTLAAELTITPLPTLAPTSTPTPYTEAGFKSLYAETIEQLETENGITERTILFVVENQVYRRKMQDAITGDLPCTQEQVWALHILVEDEQQASDVLSRLDSGEEWSSLATTLSTDTSNKDRGGDLGWFGRGRMVPEFEEAAFSLDVGGTSEPVQTSFGWHIIRVIGKEERPLTFDECQQIRLSAYQDWIAELREEYDIEIMDYWIEHIPTEPTLPEEIIGFANQAAPQPPQVLPSPQP